MKEQRKEHRLKANVPIKLSYGSNKDMMGRTENVSRLGTYVEMAKEIPAGKSVNIHLELPAYTQDASLIGDVFTKGTIFRCSPIREIEGQQWYGLGIFFTDFAGSQDKIKLSSFVDYLIEKEDQEIKEGLRRRKEKDQVHILARQKKDISLRQAEFQKEALGLLRSISDKLDRILNISSSQKKSK